MNWRQMKLVSVMAVAVFISSGCSNKVSWQEEVKLSTGETITIEREVKHKGGGAAWPQGQGSVPMEHIIRFRYPAQTGVQMEWHSTKWEPQGTYAELPLVLDLSKDNTWHIFTKVYINDACIRYSKYQFRNGAWSETLLNDDIEIHPTNLFLAAGGVGIEGLISLQEKSRVNSNILYTAELKQVGPKKYSCQGGYSGPYPPKETPPDCIVYPYHPACQK